MAEAQQPKRAKLKQSKLNFGIGVAESFQLERSSVSDISTTNVALPTPLDIACTSSSVLLTSTIHAPSSTDCGNTSADSSQSSSTIPTSNNDEDQRNFFPGDCNKPCCLISSTGPMFQNQCIIERKETARIYGKGINARERYFNFDWYKNIKWLFLCITRKKAFCTVCRFSVAKNLVNFSKCADKAFISIGMNDWKDAVEKFSSHEDSQFHKECVLKRMAFLKQTSVVSQLVKQKLSDQLKNQKCLLQQIQCLQFLVRQGIAIRGHTEEESNFQRLLELLSRNDDELQMCTRKYTSHDVLNELIKEMYKQVLLNLLTKIKAAKIFAIVVDETRDISGLEQLCLSIRWVSESGDYKINEDFLGLYECPKTDANSLVLTIKDILLRCGLNIANLRGQTYDGASVLQGKISGVAKQIKDLNPKALSVHCVNHSLNLILQEAGSSCAPSLRAFSFIREVYELVNCSPKRLPIFQDLRKSFLSESTGPTSLKPLCTTRWTARSSAIQAVLSNYEVLYNTLEEIIEQGGNTEAVKKAPGLQAQMSHFDVYLGLKVSMNVFTAAEEVARVLQSKDVTSEAVKNSVGLLTNHLNSIRDDVHFKVLFEDSVQKAPDFVQPPSLKKKRKLPRRLQEGSEAYNWKNPEEFFRSQFFEMIDLILKELIRRFDQPTLLLLMSIEKLIIEACDTNHSKTGSTIKIPENIIDLYSDEININNLQTQLQMLPGLVKLFNENTKTQIKKVTKLETIWGIIAERSELRSLFSEVDKLIRIYLTIPMSNATAERTFSSLRRLKTYLRSTMTEQRLNHLLFLHTHKDLTDTINLKEVIREFASANDNRSNFFGKIQ